MHVRVLVVACCCWALAVQVLSSSTQHVTVDSTVASAEVFNVRHYGAVGDNTTLDTISVREAAKALFHAGGGTLLFPSGGNFLTGPFNISSNSIVVIEAGATVTGSIREEDYPLVDPIAGPHPYGGSMPHPLI